MWVNGDEHAISRRNKKKSIETVSGFLGAGERRVPFALARTRGLTEDLNSLFGVKGIHRAFMSSLVIFLVVVVFVAGGDDGEDSMAAAASIGDDDDVRRRGRSSANADDAATVALLTSKPQMPTLAFPGDVDDRQRRCTTALLLRRPGTFMTKRLSNNI